MPEAAFLYLGLEAPEGALVTQEDELVTHLETAWPCLTGQPGAPRLRAILERLDAVTFGWFPSPAAARGWPIGRVFGALGELTWRREDGLTHIVLVTDAPTVPPPFTGSAHRLQLLQPNPRLDTVQLWGKSQPDGTWREERIPDTLTYPISGAPRLSVELQLRRYIFAGQPDDGTVDFVRYVDVN